MFLRHKTSVVPKRTPKSIIKTGPYQYSRNPIYLADAIVLFGFILTVGSVISFILIPLFLWVISARFINGEEAEIRAAFGQEFEDYCKQTRRWV
jgi:protein-S-isoprenylcysteine O-methyltransferase Ste14